MAIFASVKINVPENIYETDPEQTKLGKNIINYGIQLIDELGFESFTFKKLAAQIPSTEASIYRYFKSKHHLLVYLVSWYWSWLEYQIDYQTNNIDDPEKRLKIAIKIIALFTQKASNFSYINEQALYRIVLSEAPKTYYTKNVDADNQLQFFKSYKSLVKKIAGIMLEINPNYPFSHALASTLVESAHQQVYFSLHLPSLTDVNIRNQEFDKILDYLEHLSLVQLR